METFARFFFFSLAGAFIATMVLLRGAVLFLHIDAPELAAILLASVAILIWCWLPEGWR